MLLSGYFISPIKRLNLHLRLEVGAEEEICQNDNKTSKNREDSRRCSKKGTGSNLGGFVWPLSETCATQHKERERAFLKKKEKEERERKTQRMSLRRYKYARIALG